MKIDDNSKSLLLLKPIPSYKKTIVFICLLTLLFAILLTLIPWQQTAIGTGRVIAYSATDRQQNISALNEGRLGKWFVQEGSVVKKGDKVVEIYDNDPAIIHNLQIEKEALTTRYQTAKKAAEISYLNVQRQQLLYKQGITSKRNLELAEIEYAKLQNEEANIKSEFARLNVRLARQQNLITYAPMDGMILRRMHGEGSVMVKAGDILAVFVPETNSRAVELLIDGNDIPLIHPGQQARLQFEGWPAIQFSGWPSVAVGTFGGTVQVVDTMDNGKGEFRILVIPKKDEQWPEPKYLRQGVRAHGWVLLSQVRLGYELWRRFNGFPPAQEKPQ